MAAAVGEEQRPAEMNRLTVKTRLSVSFFCDRNRRQASTTFRHYPGRYSVSDPCSPRAVTSGGAPGLRQLHLRAMFHDTRCFFLPSTDRDIRQQLCHGLQTFQDDELSACRSQRHHSVCRKNRRAFCARGSASHSSAGCPSHSLILPVPR